MRYEPCDSEYDQEELQRMNAQPWMVEMLSYNSSYLGWGPHEDYMMGAKGSEGWDQPVFFETWKEFASQWELDDLNEVVNFYFNIDRKSKTCESCDGGGLNPETKQISDDFYDFEGRGTRWVDNITQDEVEALQEAGRLRVFDNREYIRRENLTAEEVNAANRKGSLGFGNFTHDGINRHILIKTRAKRLGVYGHCPDCIGHGHVFTEPDAKLQLILWFIHPRKGCSRGVEVAHVEQSDLPAVFSYLREAADRNASRFSKLPQGVVSQ